MRDNLFSSRIIQSALDFDVYKVNMMAAVASYYPDIEVTYKFIVRSDRRERFPSDGEYSPSNHSGSEARRG